MFNNNEAVKRFIFNMFVSQLKDIFPDSDVMGGSVAISPDGRYAAVIAYVTIPYLSNTIQLRLFTFDMKKPLLINSEDDVTFSYLVEQVEQLEDMKYTIPIAVSERFVTVGFPDQDKVLIYLTYLTNTDNKTVLPASPWRKLITPGLDHSMFGASLDLTQSGNELVVAAPWENGRIEDRQVERSGVVYFYKYDDGAYDFLLQHNKTRGIEYDYFGVEVKFNHRPTELLNIYSSGVCALDYDKELAHTSLISLPNTIITRGYKSGWNLHCGR